MPSPNPGSNDILTGVAASSGSDAWVVGTFSNTAGNQPLALHLLLSPPRRGQGPAAIVSFTFELPLHRAVDPEVRYLPEACGEPCGGPLQTRSTRDRRRRRPDRQGRGADSRVWPRPGDLRCQQDYQGLLAAIGRWAGVPSSGISASPMLTTCHAQRITQISTLRH